MYLVRPRISDNIGLLIPPPATVCANREKKARYKINPTLRKLPHAFSGHEFQHNLPIYFWSDGEDWIELAKIIDRTEHDVIVKQKNKLKTTTFDQVKQLLPKPIHLDNTDEKTAPPIPQSTSLDTHLVTSNHQPPTNVTAGTVSGRELEALQKDTISVLNG